MSKKVMVAIPTTDFVHINFAVALASMVISTKAALSVHIARGSSICQNRNTLVQVAKNEGAEFIMFIDNDMSFPPFTVDRMIHVIEEKRLDVLGCNYLFKAPPHQWMAIPKEGQETLEAIDEVHRLPTGMMMIRMSVFDKLDTPYFNYDAYTDDKTGACTVASEDYYFCDRARDKGIKIFMDTDLSFGIVHWGSPLGVRWIPEDPGYQYLQEPLKYQARP